MRPARASIGARIARHRPRSPVATASCVFVVAFCLFSLSQGPGLVGYEPETAAVTEGFVRTGEFKYPADVRPVFGEGFPQPSGKVVGRAGLPEQLGAVPFYVTGAVLDRLAPRTPRYWRNWTQLFYNPAVAALGAALLFLIMLRLGRTARWGLAVAGFYTLGSIAWPYAKIGMDTTTMLAMIGTFAAALAADETGRRRWWALAGFCAGAAVASKPYALPAVMVILCALLPWRSAGARRLLAVAVPFVVWMAAMLWFNYSRVGNALKTGNSDFEATLAAPLNFLGFFFSPGKSIFLYSPLVLIGAIGAPALWRANRRVAVAAILGLLTFTATVALAPFWSDETWGPRYMVPVAWLGLLPIPWFVTSRVRRSVLAAVAVLAVGVQVVGVSVNYGQILQTAPPLVGSPVLTYPRVPVPLGRDSVRWVPAVSPLLLQTMMVVSRVGEAVGAAPLTYSYRPYGAQPRSVTFTGDKRARADFWWLHDGTRGVLALLPLLLCVLAVIALGRTARDPAHTRIARTRSPGA